MDTGTAQYDEVWQQMLLGSEGETKERAARDTPCHTETLDHGLRQLSTFLVFTIFCQFIQTVKLSPFAEH